MRDGRRVHFITLIGVHPLIPESVWAFTMSHALDSARSLQSAI